MALRPEISGFSLGRLDHIFKSGDDDVLQKLIVELDEFVRFDDPATRAESQAVLKRAVYEGHRWTDLDEEGETHVMAAIVMAGHGQTHLKTDSNQWTMKALWDFTTNHHERLSKKGRRPLYAISGGRPLFGKRINTDWSFYGFLLSKEITSLRTELSELQDREASFRGIEFMGGFLDELVKWLKTIEDARKELWFYAY